ncbi:MAG: V4R domain-containing protein [Candidatus Freyarchaeota archaeon]
MKIRRIGIDYINKTLGRLFDGLSVLMVADSFTLSDTNRLAGLFSLNFLEKGGAVITVQTDLPFNRILKETRESFSDEKNKVLRRALREGRFHYLDLVSGENETVSTYGDSGNIRRIANDTNRIVYEINTTKNQIRQNFPDTPILVKYASISSSIIDFDSQTVLKMIRRLTIDTKRKGDIFLGVVNRDIHEPKVTNTLNHFADYVIDFGLETINDNRQSYVRLSRTPLIGDSYKVINQRFAYFFTGDDFFTLFPLFQSFEELKESISFNELGQLSVLGWPHVFTPMEPLIIFFKAAEKRHDYEKCQQILFELGQWVGIGAARLVESRLGVNNRELFEKVLKYNTLAGWGRLLSTVGSIDSGKLKIMGISTVALAYGRSDRPVCTFISGALAGILKVATGKDWKCREEKCMAVGDEYCEFVLEAE